MHVGIQRINRFDDRLICDLRIGVTHFLEQIDLGHHRGDIDAGRDRVDRCLVRLAVGADFDADLPHFGAVDLAHGVALMAVICLNHAANLITGRNLGVDLHQNLEGLMIGRRVGAAENILVCLIQCFVDRENAMLGDHVANRPSDRLNRIGKGFFL